MLAQSRPYEEFEGKTLYEIGHMYQNQIRHQICNEIRNAFYEKCRNLLVKNPNIADITLNIRDVEEFLDKVEKGE